MFNSLRLYTTSSGDDSTDGSFGLGPDDSLGFV